MRATNQRRCPTSNRYPLTGGTAIREVIILHGLRRWFDKRGELRGGGQRVSRHYYDLHQLAATPVGAAAIADAALGADCVGHARMFFNRPDFDLAKTPCPAPS